VLNHILELHPGYGLVDMENFLDQNIGEGFQKLLPL
jgi:hypothetical protein